MKVVARGQDAKRRRTEEKAHLQGVQTEPGNAVADAYPLRQHGLAAPAAPSDDVKHPVV